MNDRAEKRSSAQAAAEAVKAYIRMNRATLASDGELLALLLPERFEGEGVRDLQRFVIDRLKDETASLRAERYGLKMVRESATRLGDGVKRVVLELLDSRSFEDAIAVATSAAPAFGADRAALCVEGEEGAAPTGTEGVRLIAPGTSFTLLGRDSMGAILSSGGEILLGRGGGECRSLAIFRLRIGRDTPAAIYVLGSREAGVFESEETASDLGFFARALERAIRAWLDLPRF